MKKISLFLFFVVLFLTSCITPKDNFKYSAFGNIKKDTLRGISEEYPDVTPQYKLGDKVYVSKRASEEIIKLNGGPWMGEDFYIIFEIDTIKN